MAKVVVRQGRNIGAEYRLNADRLLMGRRSANPIPILDPKSSREHAVILRKGDQFFVLNMSRNGTYVNDAPASAEPENPTPIKPGDKIRIGDTSLEVVDERAEPINLEIPGYQILEKVGLGGMGVVYKAKQLSMDRVVALKILNDKYSSNAEFVERFIREARAAGKLNHPNVIHVHDVSKSKGMHYFSMEFVDGNSVKEMLRINGKIDANLALDITVQTAKALEFAHENGVIHRDIKPDNLMLNKEQVVKIADLGIAKSFEEQPLPGGAKSDRRVMGTPHYMAPEQALGKEIDHRVDIYALGATFYHMLTGQTPFTGSTAHEVIKAHIQESLAPVQEFCPDVPDPVCFVVERMMAKMPEKRYPNMTKLIEDLEKVRKGMSEGIERMEAGDSTILPAVKGKKSRTPRKRETEDIGTGLQTPVKKVALFAGLAILFVGIVATVVAVVAKKSMDDPANPPVTPTTPTGPVTGTNPAVNPNDKQNAEAQEALNEAKRLLAQDPASAGAESLLNTLIGRFGTTKAAEEAKTLVTGIHDQRKNTERKKAQDILDAALKQEKDKGDSATTAVMAELVKAFKDAESATSAFPDIAAKAKDHASQWEKKAQDVSSKQAGTEWQDAQAKVGPALQSKDFDAARAPIQEFLGKTDNAKLKEEATAKLKSVDDEADAEFTRAKEDATRQERDPSRPIPLQMAVWNTYIATVKDAKHKDDAAKAKADLDTKAQAMVKDEEPKITELVKQFDYAGAIQKMRQLSRRLEGTPLGDLMRGQEKNLTQCRDLFDKVIAAMGEKLKAGPVALPFGYKDPKWSDVQSWQLSRVTPEKKMEFEALPKNSAPSLIKNFKDFAPMEQYLLFKTFLAKPSPEEHLALAAFCKERGLDKEAGEHETLAAAKP